MVNIILLIVSALIGRAQNLFDLYLKILYNRN